MGQTARGCSTGNASRQQGGLWPGTAWRARADVLSSVLSVNLPLGKHAQEVSIGVTGRSRRGRLAAYIERTSCGADPVEVAESVSRQRASAFNTGWAHVRDALLRHGHFVDALREGKGSAQGAASRGRQPTTHVERIPGWRKRRQQPSTGTVITQRSTHRSSSMRSRSSTDGTKGGSGSLGTDHRRVSHLSMRERVRQGQQAISQALLELIVQEGEVAAHEVAALEARGTLEGQQAAPPSRAASDEDGAPGGSR